MANFAGKCSGYALVSLEGSKQTMHPKPHFKPGDLAYVWIDERLAVLAVVVHYTTGTLSAKDNFSSPEFDATILWSE